MKMMVLVNPVAGAGKPLRLLPKIRQWLSRSPHQFSITVPRSPEEMRSEIERASAQGFDAILLCGGDGTIHKALPAILKAGLPFGYLPCGRGNDFARNVGFTTDLRKSCRFPQNPSFRRLDLPTINQTPFMSTAYVGFDAEVNRLFNEGKGYFGGALAIRYAY
jgi:Sphingosine kinase and enzymes related to eukaryotic diacylglycerol kinase